MAFADLAVDWPPLAVNRGRLTLGYGRADFLPEGLLVPKAGATLPWDDVREPDSRGTGWALVAEPLGSAGVRLLVDVRSGPAGPERHEAGGATPFDEAPVVAAGALVLYLRDVPAARAGLGVPARVSSLLRALRRSNFGRRPDGLPREPWMGDKHDLHHAVPRGLRDVWPHWYALRGVAGDPLPDLATAVAAVRERLRPGLRERIPEEDVAERVAPYLAVDPWPFSLLLG